MRGKMISLKLSTLIPLLVVISELNLLIILIS